MLSPVIGAGLPPAAPDARLLWPALTPNTSGACLRAETEDARGLMNLASVDWLMVEGLELSRASVTFVCITLPFTITSMSASGTDVMVPSLRRVHLPAFLTAICHLAACGPRFGVERWAGSGALGCARLWPAVARCLCWLCRLTRFSRHRAAPTTH